MDDAQCGSCGAILSEPAEEQRSPCPLCGSTARTIPAPQRGLTVAVGSLTATAASGRLGWRVPGDQGARRLSAKADGKPGATHGGGCNCS